SIEAADVIPGGGRVGNGPRAERVEKRGVVASDLDVLQNGTAAEQVKRDVEDVIRILVRPRHFQDAKALVERVHESNAFDQPHDCADAAAGDRAATLGEFVDDSTSAELRLAGPDRLSAAGQWLETRDDLSLLSVESS